MVASLGSAGARTIVRWERKRAKETVNDVTKHLRPRMALAGDIVKKSVVEMISGPSPAPPGAPPGDAPGDAKDLKGSIMRRTYGRGAPGFIVIPRDAKHKEQLGRLQKGFTGTDKAGRTYRQAPRPFTGKALDRVKGEVLRTVTRG